MGLRLQAQFRFGAASGGRNRRQAIPASVIRATLNLADN